jgi:hypothetical protein
MSRLRISTIFQYSILLMLVCITTNHKAFADAAGRAAYANANPTFDYATCSEVTTTIMATENHMLKMREDGGKSVAELEREYDQLMAKYSILRGIKELRQDYAQFVDYFSNGSDGSAVKLPEWTKQKMREINKASNEFREGRNELVKGIQAIENVLRADQTLATIAKYISINKDNYTTKLKEKCGEQNIKSELKTICLQLYKIDQNGNLTPLSSRMQQSLTKAVHHYLRHDSSDQKSVLSLQKALQDGIPTPQVMREQLGAAKALLNKMQRAKINQKDNLASAYQNLFKTFTPNQTERFKSEIPKGKIDQALMIFDKANLSLNESLFSNKLKEIKKTLKTSYDHVRNRHKKNDRDKMPDFDKFIKNFGDQFKQCQEIDKVVECLQSLSKKSGEDPLNREIQKQKDKIHAVEKLLAKIKESDEYLAFHKVKYGMIDLLQQRCKKSEIKLKAQCNYDPLNGKSIAQSLLHHGDKIIAIIDNQTMEQSPAVKKNRKMSKKACKTLDDIGGREESNAIAKICTTVSLREDKRRFRQDFICTDDDRGKTDPNSCRPKKSRLDMLGKAMVAGVRDFAPQFSQIMQNDARLSIYGNQALQSVTARNWASYYYQNPFYYPSYGAYRNYQMYPVMGGQDMGNPFVYYGGGSATYSGGGIGGTQGAGYNWTQIPSTQ